MSDTKHNRKDFLKRLGVTVVGTAVAATAMGANVEGSDLIDGQKQFLNEYEDWLKEFNAFVKKRNINPLDIENNKRLMELSAESEGRRTTLELYMKDPKFVKHFNRITEDVTKEIS